MSDVDDNLEFYTAFEDELYKETASVKSDDEVDSELEAALYQNVHFASSFVITPSKDTQEESNISEDPNLLDSPAADGSGPELPNKVNCGSVNENEEQGISKYPEVKLVFANEKNKTKGSKVKDNTSCMLLNLDQTTDDIDTEDGCKTSDGWELIAADLMPALLKSKVKKRYIRCFNCNEKGHRTLQCTLPKKEKMCSLCGTKGHLKQKCPNELCFNCLMPGHQIRHCRMPRSRQTDVCRRCHAFGHYESSCPDRWRQYHLTIEPGKIISPKSIPNPAEYEHVSCYNCGGEGHLGHECLEDRSDGSFSGSFPFVVKYDKFTTDSPNKNQHNTRQHIHFIGNKRRKLNDHRKDEGQQGEYGGDNWNVAGNNTDSLDRSEKNEFTELPKFMDGVECTNDVGYKRKKGKKKKNRKPAQEETIEDYNKYEGPKSRRRKRKMEMKMQQIKNNQDIEEDRLVYTWNMAGGTKKKNRNRKKNKVRNEAVEPNVDCHRVVTFEETLPPVSEAKTKSRKNQKKRLNQLKSRKKTEPKKIHKPENHQIPKDKQSRTVYFDYNGFV